MHRTSNQPTYKKIPYILVVMGLLCTFVYTLFAQGNTAYASGAPPGGNIADVSVRAVDIAAPAVVRIITTLNSHLTVHFSATSDVTFPQTSGGSYPVQVSGTGTFISSQGDILTADHVINPPKNQDLNQSLFMEAAQDVASYMNQNGKGQVTADQVTQQLSGGQLRSTTTFDTPTSQAFLSTDYTGPLSATNFNSLPVQIYAKVDQIEKESTPDQKDLAIIHVPMTDTPAVQLGDSSNVQVQDTLTIIGFPGNGDVSQKPTDFLTASINKINVSSIKTTSNGAPLIQVGGTVEHGDSGGPALDSNGTVVGIVSFGLVSASAQTSALNGTSFLQASNSARDLVTSLKLDTTPGAFQKLWNQAFTDYAATTAGHWHKAATEFNQLASNYPQFKAVTPYQNYATTQARTEPQTATSPATTQATPAAKGSTQPSQSPSLLSLAGTIGVVVVILLLIVALFAVIIRPRKKSGKQPAGAAAPSTPKEARVPGNTQAPKPPLSQATPAMQATKVTPPPTTPAKNTPNTQKNTPIPNPRTPVPPVQPTQADRSLPNTPQSTLALKAWPCGHMNRPNARFCSICGEPAPTPPQSRKIGQ